MIRPVAFTATHMETSSLGESVAFLTDLLAFEVERKASAGVTLKHPNSDWRLVVHEVEGAQPKSMGNHWGVRVIHNDEVRAAYEYISAHREEYGVEHIVPPEYSHGSFSIYLTEPGTNGWEIECFEDVNRKPSGGERLGGVRAPHWTTEWQSESFARRGYVPQAFTHGTLTSADDKATAAFCTEVLGLEAWQAYPKVTYIKHPASKHYLVCLGFRGGDHPFSEAFRNTLTVESTDAVVEAHDVLAKAKVDLGLRELRPVEEAGGVVSFLLQDPDHNWWEIASPSS